MSELIDVYLNGPPTANGPVHVGHLSGPYIAADIASRAARARGEKVSTICGIDVHQNWVLARADRDGIDVEKMMDDFAARIDEAFGLARVESDIYLDARRPHHQAVVAELALHLAENSAHWRDETLYRCLDCGRTLHNAYLTGTCSRCGSASNGGNCEGCGGYASSADLTDMRCACCGGAPESFTARIPVLALADFRRELEVFWTGSSLPIQIRELIAGYLQTDTLPEIPLAYPTNWGAAGVGAMQGLRLDSMVEFGLSTYYLSATAVDPAVRTVAEQQAAWSAVGRAWWFIGNDNGFHYGLLWPALYLALGARADQLGGTVGNEFYTLDGLKFSTSRNHAVWAEDLLSTEDPGLVRLYLAWDRPDSYQSDFTRARFEAFRDEIGPILSGETGAPASSAVLAQADLKRGLEALKARSFDGPLAVRCLIATAGHRDLPQWQQLYGALTGTTDGVRG